MDLRFTLMLDCTDRFAESMRDFKQAVSTACGSGMVEKVKVPDQPSDTAVEEVKDDGNPIPDTGSETEKTADEGDGQDGKSQPEEEPKDDLTETVNTQDSDTDGKEYTEADVRKAMHEARCRIEGDDYKTNKTSERYVKYHKALSAEFVRMAGLLGSDKPSTLPADKRAEFIHDCDSLCETPEGTIGRKIPF